MSACQDRIWASQAMKTALLPIKKDKPKFSFVKDDFQTICLDEPICTNCTPENFHYSTRSGFELDLTISAELRSTPSIITASHKEETKISRYYSTSNYYQSKLAVAKPLIYDCSTNYIISLGLRTTPNDMLNPFHRNQFRTHFTQPQNFANLVGAPCSRPNMQMKNKSSLITRNDDYNLCPSHQRIVFLT